MVSEIYILSVRFTVKQNLITPFLIQYVQICVYIAQNSIKSLPSQTSRHVHSLAHTRLIISISLHVLLWLHGHFILPTDSLKLRENPFTVYSFLRHTSDTIYCKEDPSDSVSVPHSLVRLSIPSYPSWKHGSQHSCDAPLPYLCVWSSTLSFPTPFNIQRNMLYIAFSHFGFSDANCVLNCE